MNPRNARIVLLTVAVIAVLLIGRAWLRARSNYRMLMDMQSKDPAVRLAAVKGLMPPERLVDIVLAYPMRIVEKKTETGRRLEVLEADNSVRIAAVDAVAEAAKTQRFKRTASRRLSAF